MDKQKDYRLLLQGIDTIQCAYFMQKSRKGGIDYQLLAEQKEGIQQSKYKHPLPICLGESEFLLQPYGTRSGYPFVLTNQDFKIELGEFNNPNFYVTFTSQGLWHKSAAIMHTQFLAWAESIGYIPYRSEGLSRVDFSFDYHLPEVDFTENWFVSRSSKDSQYRDAGKIQTFTFGKGDVVLRIYDKIAEIREKSEKVWFYPLWGQESDVWRIEWQVRRSILQRFDIKTFEDLERQQGDLLTYLASEHDTLRIPNDKQNASRDWLLHPLWLDLQDRIKELGHIGIYRSFDEKAILDERAMRMVISVYGYLKRLAAVRCLQKGMPMISHTEALEELGYAVQKIHDPLAWKFDIRRRTKEMELGKW